jgi:hypothetical protein
MDGIPTAFESLLIRERYRAIRYFQALRILRHGQVGILNLELRIHHLIHPNGTIPQTTGHIRAMDHYGKFDCRDFS